MSLPGLIASISGTKQRKKAERALNRELANAPKYKITDEAFENQAIARQQAYGRDRAIQMGEENVAQSAANAAVQARDISSSTSGLLSTIAQINANKNQQLRGLAQDESVLRGQRVQNLQAVNSAMIDEKDKAWNYNVNMPFQMRVASYRDRARVGSEMEMAGVAAQAQTESALISSVGSVFGGMMGCDERIKKDIQESDAGLSEVMKMRPVTFEYTRKPFDDGKRHVGFIAQEMKEIVPESVDIIHGMAKEGEENYLRIDFNQLVPVLVKSIQEQQKLILNLKKEIEEMKVVE